MLLFLHLPSVGEVEVSRRRIGIKGPATSASLPSLDRARCLGQRAVAPPVCVRTRMWGAGLGRALVGCTGIRVGHVIAPSKRRTGGLRSTYGVTNILAGVRTR